MRQLVRGLFAGILVLLCVASCSSSTTTQECPTGTVSCPTTNKCCDPATPYLCPGDGYCYQTSAAANGDANCGGWIKCG